MSQPSSSQAIGGKNIVNGTEKNLKNNRGIANNNNKSTSEIIRLFVLITNKHQKF